MTGFFVLPLCVLVGVVTPSQLDAPPPATSTHVETYDVSHGIWDALAACESPDGNGGVDWHEGDGGLGPYRGGLQWHPDTWVAVKPDGAPDDPADATREQEIHAAEHLIAKPWGSLRHWPVCARKIGAIP